MESGFRIEAAVCDFVSVGTVSFVRVAGAQRLQSAAGLIMEGKYGTRNNLISSTIKMRRREKTLAVKIFGE